ncbi:TPA: VENN motif pre-toxin domain-containing protein [Escherichia coli]|nr:VENN motif pre-toxin domain-containing protein [Escherichia coli]
MGMISDIGGQVADIARTQGELNALKVAQDKYGPLQADATEEQRQAYLAKLRDTPEYKKEQEKYGTGSDMQRGIQAATAALQGLAGGNMAGALAGASAPELANIIGHHAGIDDNTAAKAIAHAILGGVTAALQGNSAAAGAIGAGTGEVIASAIAKSLYPGVDPSKLTEDQKQTVSTLATLSAGMAGGIASGDVAGAAAGAGAGKNVVENNLLGGSEWLQTEKAREHGADVLSCSDNPSGEACKRGQAENKAYAAALATSSVSLLSRSAQAMWALGAGANAGIGSMVDSSVDPENAIIAGWVNVITMGQGWKGTVGWNAAGGALGNWIDDKDPLSGALINGTGSGIGYGLGKGLSWGVNAGANWWKGGWDPKFNSELRSVTEVKGDYGLSKEMKPSKVPSSFGDVGGSAFSEITGKGIEKISSSNANGDKK